MHVIALVTQKGGCGKSTLALSLAVAARGGNRRTLILDTDPQRTVSTWWQDREQDTPDCVEVFESTALPKALDLAKQKRFDLVFIDTPGRDDPINARVIVSRQSYNDAYAVGLGVTEYEPHGKAAQEVLDLWQWLDRKMGKMT